MADMPHTAVPVPPILRSRRWSKAAIPITATGNAYTDWLVLEGLFDRLAVAVKNADGANALDQFLAEALAHPDAAEKAFVTNAEFNTGTALAGRLVYLVTNPTNLAAGGTSFFILDVRGIYAVRFGASFATADGLIEVRAQAA